MLVNKLILWAFSDTHVSGLTIHVQVQQSLSHKGTVNRKIMSFRDQGLCHSRQMNTHTQRHKCVLCLYINMYTKNLI